VRLLGWPDKSSVINTYKEHFRICELLLAGDLATAQAEMTVHIRKSQEQASKLTLNQLYNNRNIVSFE
jgi:DNA-binding GntR family transcriptional regulator